MRTKCHNYATGISEADKPYSHSISFDCCFKRQPFLNNFVKNKENRKSGVSACVQTCDFVELIAFSKILC